MSERGDCFGGGRHFYVKAGESGRICANCGMGERRQVERRDGKDRRTRKAVMYWPSGRDPREPWNGDRRKGERRDG